MKKIITYIFMISLAAVLFTACGSKQNNTTDDTPTDTASKTTDDTAAKATEDATARETANATAETTENTTADTAADATTDPTDKQESKSQNSDTIISEKKAKSIALKDANLKDSEISKFRIKLERDNGIQKYEIDFNSGKQEYDYEIDATSGKILEKDKEPID